MEGWATLTFILLAIYFAPTIAAHDKKKRNFGAIFALNLFLGWTLIGWVAALVWSLTNSDSDKGSL